MYNTKSHNKFKILMVKSSLCDYSDAYILVSGTVIVVELAAGRKNNVIEIAFKDCVPLTDFMNEINNT